MNPSRSRPDFRKPVKVFDFFCGCGGTSAGLQAAGMEIVLGLDNDADASRTFQANFPKAVVLQDDIRELSAEHLDRFVANCGNHPLLFSACAPCQPFSQHQRRNTACDERFGLLGHLVRFVEEYLPDLLFVENVPGLGKAGIGENIFKAFTRTLQNLGYDTRDRVVRSQDYGVPQRRARLVLLASRFGPVGFPGKTHGAGPGHVAYSTVADWIGDLPPIAAGETHPCMPDHRAAKLSALNLQRIRATPEGGSWMHWPPELVPACHRSGFRGFTDVYGRLRWDAPAPALTTRCISYSNGRYGHPQQDRALSVREAARLQTFPCRFVFTGPLHAQARQIGNAVPALLAQRFGEQLADFVAGLAGTAGT